MRHGGVADPGKFLPVELDLFPSDQLIEIECGLDRADGEAVGFGYAIDVIGRHHGGDARHVLHDNIWRAGNIFRDELGRRPCVEITDAARRRTGHQSDGFALVERRLGVEWSRK